jgi:hypothetical protein
MRGVVVVLVVVVRVVAVVGFVVDAAAEVVLVVEDATVSAPGSADRIVSGEAMATPMTPSATASTDANAICAPEDRRGPVACTGMGCGVGTYCGAGCLGG